MKLDKHSSVPLYYQLKENIIKKIETGVYAPGSKIESEMVLCEEHNLSRPTVRQAISELVSEGQLQIVKGKGTFVSKSEDKIDIKSFTGTTFSFLNSAKYNKSEIEDIVVIKDVDVEIENAFGQTSFSQEGYVKICKILSIKNLVYAYIESYIPVSIFPSLVNDIKNDRSMVDITANKYAYLPAKNTCKIHVRPANSIEGKALEISRGTPVLVSQSQLISRSGAICEYVIASLRCDICQLQL